MKVGIIQIPNIDATFVDDLMHAGIDGGSLEVTRDVYYHYEEPKKEDSEERLTKFGFDVEKIKRW